MVQRTFGHCNKNRREVRSTDPQVVPSLRCSWSLSLTRCEWSEGTVRKVTNTRQCTSEHSPTGTVVKWEVVDAEYGTVVRFKTMKNLIKELESSESGAVSNIFLKGSFFKQYTMN